MNKLEIEVGDRVTYIKKREIVEKITEIITKDYKSIIGDKDEVLKIERIGSNGWYTVYEKEEEILDEKEKKYLKAVIKPFRKNIKYIVKIRHSFDTREYLRIILEGCNIGALPDFEPGTMYKNMKIEKEYSLKELGLEE